ncbi:MAG: hypothetical protein Q9217_001046, partial [Psora testacea]
FKSQDLWDTDAIESRIESRHRIDPTQASNVVQHQVRDLPTHHLFEPDIPEAFKDASMRVRYEYIRLASHYQYPLELANPGDIADFEDYQCLWRYFEKCAGHVVQHPPEMVTPLVWKAAGDNFAGISLKGKLVFRSTNVGPLFQLHLEALRKERSCRFQRAFGGDRFLYLSVPAITASKLPSHVRDQYIHIQSSYKEWLQKEKQFLGCKWETFFVEQKTKKRGRFVPDDEVGGQLVVLFATEVAQRSAPMSFTGKKDHECLAQSTIRVEEVFNWFFPTQSNIGHLQCKAYARLELGFSKTLPTLTFFPSQIKEVPDILADGTAESTSFLERGRRLKEYFDPQDPKVMNDGCSRLSVGAARRIARDLGLDERPPSVFQARIGPWKGIWMVDGEKSPDKSQSDIWIEVTPSQRKFNRHAEDLEDDTFDPTRTTFEVVAWSMPVTSARLSPTLIPILVDRRVPEQALHDLFQTSLAYERKILMDAVQNPHLLYRWIYSKAPILREEQEDAQTVWLGSLPLSKPKAALYLLEHGFLPYESPHLAGLVQDIMQKHLNDLKKSLKPRVGRSIDVFAVADPVGCLNPGEAHLAFSENFIDEQSGSNEMMLTDIELVVGRQPALRGSDMQKIRAVFKPELKHLLDVIVFPSRGVFPLAERMQNGDYDGDRFWVTWDPAIVDKFENAPSPFKLPSPESFGIQVDDSRLDDTFLTSNKQAIRALLNFNFNFRCQQGLLGRCTNFHNSLAYSVGSLRSVGVDALADLHDLLVDSSKMGFTFTEDNWRYFRISDPRITEKNPAESLHKRLQGGASLEDIRSAVPKDAVDRLLLLKVIPTVNAILTEIQGLWTEDSIKDEALFGLLQRVKQLAEIEPDYREDLDLLVKGIKRIYGTWNQRLREDTYDRNTIASIEECHKDFRSLMPTTALWNLHQEMEELISSSPSAWDLIKASVTYVEYPDEKFTWRMTGKELGLIKAWSNRSVGGPRTIIPVVYANMKPKSIKRIPVQEHEDD